MQPKSRVRKIRAGFAALLAGLMVFTLLPTASVAQQVRLRLVTFATPNTHWHQTATRFKELAESKSGGKIRMTLDHSGATGDWPQVIESVLIGTTDVVLESIGTLDRYTTVAGVESYPYLVKDIEHFKKVYYGPIGKELFKAISDSSGFHIAGAAYRGARHLSTSKPVANADELKNIKIRVPPLKMYRRTWELLGTSVVPMGVDELFTSLQQKLVDGQENPLEVLIRQKYYEVQKYVVETAHIMGAYTFIFSKARFNSLSEEYRKLLVESAEQATLEATERMVKTEESLKADLIKLGMEFKPIDRAVLQARLAPLPNDFPELAAWVKRIQESAK